MSFGGFFGIGEEHRLIPWGALSYHSTLDGFVTAVTAPQVKEAPHPPRATDTFDPTWEERLHEHYRVRGYGAAMV